MSPIRDLMPAARAAFALRPVAPGDAPALQSLVRNLPSADRRYRFHGAVRELTDEELRRMTCIDPRRDFAIVATDSRTGIVIADARWVRDAVGDAAEFALMVASGWRRRGIGADCIFELRRVAAERGLSRIYGFILADNMPMRALMQHCGFIVRPDFRDRERVVAVSQVAPVSSPLASANDRNHPFRGQPAPVDMKDLGYAGMHGSH
jgi:RimJ/RimL family protein N-acetyltransferase